MLEREGRKKWTRVLEGIGVGGMDGRSGRSALSRKRPTSFSEKRGEKPVAATHGGSASRAICLAKARGERERELNTVHHTAMIYEGDHLIMLASICPALTQFCF